MHLLNNRGMFLESLVNYAIQKYYDNNTGLFFKQPVNIIPLKKHEHLITKSYFKAKSWMWLLWALSGLLYWIWSKRN